MNVFDIEEHRAIHRLFELVRDGKTDDGEFDRLDLLIYEGLAEAYPPEACNAERVVMPAAA